MKQNLIVLTLLLAWIVATPRKAHASCWGYIDRTVSCVGGCIAESDTCFFGCISGTCNNQGGSGLCCKTIYYTAVIYPDGDPEECSFCSEARPVAGHKEVATTTHTRVQFWGGGTPGLIQLGGELASLRIERQVFVPNRCSHSYDPSLAR